jgi:hypothetical protein
MATIMPCASSLITSSPERCVTAEALSACRASSPEQADEAEEPTIGVTCAGLVGRLFIYQVFLVNGSLLITQRYGDLSPRTTTTKLCATVNRLVPIVSMFVARIALAMQLNRFAQLNPCFNQPVQGRIKDFRN